MCVHCECSGSDLPFTRKWWSLQNTKSTSFQRFAWENCWVLELYCLCLHVFSFRHNLLTSASKADLVLRSYYTYIGHKRLWSKNWSGIDNELYVKWCNRLKLVCIAHHHIISYHIIHITSHRAIPYHIMLHRLISHHVISYHITSWGLNNLACILCTLAPYALCFRITTYNRACIDPDLCHHILMFAFMCLHIFYTYTNTYTYTYTYTNIICIYIYMINLSIFACTHDETA